MNNPTAIHPEASSTRHRGNTWFAGLILAAMLVISTGCGRRPPSITYNNKGLALFQKIEHSPLSWQTLGTSVEGRTVFAMEKGSGDKTTLIFGGFHGDEMLGVELVLAYAEYLSHPEVSPGSKVVVIPCLNPDGLVRGTRTNAREIDINRNFPTANWTDAARASRYNPGPKAASEPETQIAIELIEQYQPDRIVSVHIPLEAVNYDGPAKELAEHMAMLTGYPVKADIGYATPGSFGTYAGKELGIPVITLELPQSTLNEVWEINRKALDAATEY